MDRQFMVSGTIAAALHAGLLRGIGPSKTDGVVTDVVKPPPIDFIKFDPDSRSSRRRPT